MTDPRRALIDRLGLHAELALEQSKTCHRAFRADHVRKAKACESIADQFEAGDFDPELMERYGMLLDDESLRDELIDTTDVHMGMIDDGFDTTEKADELLTDILHEMRTITESKKNEAEGTAIPSALN